MKKVLIKEAELAALKACLLLIKYDSDDADGILSSLGVKYRDYDSLLSYILRKETSLEFIKSDINRKNADKNKREAVGFYDILATVERQLNRQLNTADLNIERWCAYIKDIHQKNEAEKSIANETRNKMRNNKK